MAGAGYAAYAYFGLGLGAAASMHYSVNKITEHFAFGGDSILNNESTTDGNSKSPEQTGLPTDLVGDQSHPNAGQKRPSTRRHTSGVLTPENGGSVGEDGTGADAWKDFETLTGGNYNPDPEPGTGQIVGDNGVRYRPGTANSGARIEIPSNGDKPHEGLHY